LARVLAALAGAGFLLVVLGVILGLALVGRHGGGPVQGWDDTVWRWSIQHRGPLVGIDKAIATVGDAALLGPLCLVLSLVLFAIWRSPRALVPLVAYVGGEAIVTIIRAVIHRGRPATANYPAPNAVPGVHETSFSFPSGHAVAVTAVFFALLGLLALTRRTWWPWLLAFCLAAFVADSRLLLGVHWFSDVTLGLVLGAAWGVVVALTCARLTWSDLQLGRRTTGAIAVVR
jgi:undecaprenyl-diphosphatase